MAKPTKEILGRASEWRLPLPLMLLILVMSFAAASSSNNGPQSYISVRALDQFGHSVQLKHAREAAHRHGRLVVVGQSVNNETVVVSMGRTPMVHLVSLTSIGSRQESGAGTTSKFDVVALCCTGVKGDASWMIQEVQSHCATVWDRYNHHLDAPSVAHVISRLLGSFGGEDVDLEWQSSVGRTKSEWSRPLGIQTMILSQSGPILLVEPSGRVLTTPKVGKTSSVTSTSSRNRRNIDRLQIGAMGKESHLVPEHLRRMEDPPEKMDSIKLREFLLELVMDLAPANVPVDLLVEVLSTKGVERTSIRVENGKKMTSS
jgi:20S proteasome alpha/beta subunit